MKNKKEDNGAKEIMESEVPDPNAAYNEENSFDMSGMQSSAMDQPVRQQRVNVQKDIDSDEEQDFSSEPIARPPSFAEPVRVDYAQSNIDEIEELVESVVEEKWRTLIENFGDIGTWRERTRTDVLSLKQELIRLENRFDNLQRAIIGKIKDYDENIMEVGSEIKALGKVFEKILDPLTTNIKELDRITKQLKK